MIALLDRKKTYFVLWRLAAQTPPSLVIGQFQAGPPPMLSNSKTLQMSPSPLSDVGDLWEIAAQRLRVG